MSNLECFYTKHRNRICVAFYFSIPQAGKQKDRPIPNFGFVVLAVKGIPWCVKHNSFDKFCGKQSFEKILFAKSNLTMQSAIAQFLLSSENWCDSLLTEYKRLRWKKNRTKEEMTKCKEKFCLFSLESSHHCIYVQWFQ